MAHLLRCLIVLLSLTSCNDPALNEAKEREAARHVIIAAVEDPVTFDPRLERNIESATYLRMIYEGLTRLDPSNKIQPALAAEITISSDLRTYTFTLKETLWSDGTPLTAQDFIETWRSTLSPSFPAPNAYQLYLIKGAKDAKEGRIPLDSPALGISSPSPNTLVVELEQPTPYFLDLISCHFFFPVHISMRDKNLNTKADVISNGPFKLESFSPRNDVTFVRNPLYWDQNQVKLDKITIQILDERTALELFESKEIDWAGSPLSVIPQAAIPSLTERGKLSIAVSSGTHWFRINTKAVPFTNEKIRRAFALAIDRREIVDHVIQGNQIPAMAIVPPSFGLKATQFFADNDIKTARSLFNEGLKELAMKIEDMPKITISYVTGERPNKIAQSIQQQWNKAFGVEIALEATERQVLLDKMHQGVYQLGLGSWYADYQDPINFLEIFASKSNMTNQTGWENPRYSDLINLSNIEPIPAKRLELLGEAEKILIDEMPVAPIYFNSYNYLKNAKLQNVTFSPMGFLDFKSAYYSMDSEASTH